MTDIKKILIASICVVLAVAIAAGVSIGVLAGTVNGLKDTVAELQQANEAQEALNASMKAELDAAKANGENIVTAEEFEAKLAAALGEQNQTMQALISTAVKNQIEDLETEGLTEAQVQEIIDAAVANCLTEADIDAIVAGVDAGLTKDEVKKIVADYTVGTLTYGQIVDLIDDADYDLRVYLEKQINAVIAEVNKLGGDLDKLEGDVANKTAKITLNAAEITFNEEGVYNLNAELKNLVDGGKIALEGDWSTKTLNIQYKTQAKDFVIDVSDVVIDVLNINAPLCHIELVGNANSYVQNLNATTASNTLIIKGVTVDTACIYNGRVLVADDAIVEGYLVIQGNNVDAEIEGEVGQVTVTSNSDGATITNDGKVRKIVIAGSDTTVTNNGTITSDVKVNGNGATITNTANGEIKGDLNITGENASVSNNGTIEGEIEGEYDALVTTVKELNDALAAGADVLVQFGADITGDVKITQKDGVNIVIDGNGYTFNGVMTVFGAHRQDGAETLTIKNINFVAANGAASCIVSTSDNSYAHNVTIENCTFTDVDGKVDCAAVRGETGGDKNWVITGCTVDNTMHSLVQVQNVEGNLTIENCTVNSKNGVNLNQTTNIEMIGCEFDVKGYAVRIGTTSALTSVDKNLTITNSTLTSACDDGDAVIIVRSTATNVVITLENTTLVGTTEISGNTDATTITKK